MYGSNGLNNDENNNQANSHDNNFSQIFSGLDSVKDENLEEETVSTFNPYQGYSTDGVSNYGSNGTDNGNNLNNDMNNHNWRDRFKISKKDKQKRTAFSIGLSLFYILSFLFIAVGGLYWWNTQETFYLTESDVSMITNDDFHIDMYSDLGQKSNENYTYESSNPDIVTVDELGNVHSVSEGEATITVKSKYSSKKNELDVLVEGDSIYSAEFENSNISINLNDSQIITPIINGNQSFNAEMVWKSDNPDVVAVSSNGEVRGISPGTTYVTATVRGTNVSARAKVSVSGQTVFTDEATNNNKELDSAIKDNANILNISDEANDMGYDNEVDSHISVVGVEARTNNALLTVGGSTKINYTITPDNATNKGITWDTSDASVATVDKNGNVKAVGTGTADITVKTTDGNKTSFVTIMVLDSKTKTISINKNKTTIKLWQSETLSAQVSDGSNDIVWSSSDSKIATVESNGKVTGRKEGVVDIIASTRDGKVKSKCQVTVTNKDIEVSGITLNTSKITLSGGKKYQLKVSVTPANAANQNITYKSSNTKIATVNGNGVITGVSSGTAVITATSSNGKTSSCTVVIPSVKVQKITLNRSSVQIVKGNKYNLKVSISPGNAANKSVSYSSSNKSVATVNNNGVITGVGVGTSNIKVKANDGSGKVATISVVVTPKGNLIKFSKYTSYIKNIENYIGVNFSKHMQNFAIQNPGKSNEIIYLSGVTTGCITAKKITAAQKKDLNRTIVIQIPKSQLNQNKDKRTIMWLKDTGHGQAFDIEANGTMWINAFGKEPTYSGGKWWGGHNGVMRLNFTKNAKDSAFKTLTTLKVKDSNGTVYSGLDLSVDEANDLLALRSGTKVMVYRLSSAQKGKLSLLYSFKISGTSSYRQGNDIYGGYYYVLTGMPGGKMTVSAYNMLGGVEYTKSFYINNAKQAKDLNEEPEGLKIYNGKIYIGHTHKKGNGYIFDIGILK